MEALSFANVGSIVVTIIVQYLFLGQLLDVLNLYLMPNCASNVFSDAQQFD